MKIYSIVANYSNNRGLGKNPDESQSKGMPQPAAPAPSFCANRTKTVSAAVLAGLLAIAPAAAKNTVSKADSHMLTSAAGLLTNAFEHRLVCLFNDANKASAKAFTREALAEKADSGDAYVNITQKAMDFPEQLAHNLLVVLKQEPSFKDSEYGEKISGIIRARLQIRNKKDAKAAAEFADRINRILNNADLSDREVSFRVNNEARNFGQNYTNGIFQQIVNLDKTMITKSHR